MGPLMVSLTRQFSLSFKGTEFNRRFTGCPQGGSPGGSRAVDASQSLGHQVNFLRKSALFRPHAADAYKTNGILMKMEPFWAQKLFWAQKCILGSKIDFGAQNAKNGPKMHFWAQKCFFRKSDQKVNVRLDVTEREQGIPDSGPDSIHGRPGLLKHVAFSVPLHSNKGNP